MKQQYDVIVVGGGTTGACAALAAARQGASTALIEINGFLGGNAATGLPWLGFHHPDGKLVVKGVIYEILQRLQADGGASDFIMDPIAGSAAAVNPVWLKIVLAEMMKKDNVDAHLHSLASEVEVENGHIGSVIVRSKEGAQSLAADVVVDCTDSADVAVLAGARYCLGREGDHKTQVASYAFTVGGIDMQAMLDYFERNPDQIRPFPLPKDTLSRLVEQMRAAPLFVLGAFPKLVEKAVADGLDLPRKQIVGIGYPREGEMLLVTTRVGNVNPGSVRSYSEAELEGQMQIRPVFEFIRRYMPGGSQARLLGSAHQIGIRETRHVFGDYWLTGEDLMAGKRFPDAVARGGYHLDIHSPDHKGLETNQPPVYDIPYRSLLPQGLENVLVAGRCISADHQAMSSTRVIPIAAATGEAAGKAAAIAARRKIGLRDINPEEVKV